MISLILISLAALAWLLNFTAFPESGPYTQTFNSIVLGLTALAAARLAESVLARFLRGQRRSAGSSDRLQTMLAVVVYIAALFLWLRYGVGADVTGVFATSAVVSLVLGLALQATLGNLFAGLALEIERPLKVGDCIQKGALEGRVVGLRWRSVVVRTANQTLVVLPNASLAAEPFEVIRKEEPGRQMVTFSVNSSLPPMRVIAIAEKVLRSGIEGVCDEPRPSALFLGADPHNIGALLYGARYFTPDWLARAQISSAISVRLWYALSRADIALSPDPVVHLKADETFVMTGEPTRLLTQAPPNTPPPAAIAQDLDSRIRHYGRLRRYGPDEAIDLEGGAALLVSGSAREEQNGGPEDAGPRLARLLKGEFNPKAGLLISNRLLRDISSRAALVLGPYAHNLAADYGARTDDPLMLSLALATHMTDEKERQQFLAQAPAHLSRRLNAGALVGWAAALGLEPAQKPTVTNHSAEILYLSRDDIPMVLSGLERAAEVLAARDPSLKDLTEPQIEDRLRA
jgi:hypothetical protein